MGGGCCIGDFRTTCLIDTATSCFIDCWGDGCCVGNSSALPESERHAKEVAEELAEMKEKKGADAERKEKEYMDAINSSMDAFMREVNELNERSFGGETLSINTWAIKEKNEALKRQVIGCIGNILNTRLVQTDKELSTILEERDVKKRKENFEKFVEKIEKQANAAFRTKVENTVKAQSEVISREIETREKEVTARLEDSVKELTEIMEIKEKNTAELEGKQMCYMYQSSLCDLLLYEVEG